MDSSNIVYAGFWARFISFIIDIITIISINYIMFDIFFTLPYVIEIFQKILIFAIYFFFMTYLYGQTLGKMIIGIKVISATNKERSWEDVLIREVPGKFLSIILLFTGLLLIGIHPKKQSLHDNICKMSVIWSK